MLINRQNTPQQAPGPLLAVAVVLPVLAAFGPLLAVVGPFYAFRVCALIFAMLCMLAPRAVRLSPIRSRFNLLAAVWAVMAAWLLFRVTDMTSASAELLAVGIGVLLTLALSTMADPERVLPWLTGGWLASFLLTSLIAGGETLSGRHMPNYQLGGVLDLSTTYNSPASTFGNPNAYAFFLLAAFPILITGLMSSSRLSVRVLYGLSANALPFFVLATGSRVCMAAIAIQIVVVLLFIGKRYRRRVAGFFALAGGVIISLPAMFRNTVLKDFQLGYTGGLSEWIGELTAGGQTSGAVRLNLAKDGFWMTQDSWLLGVGPGNFETIMKSGVAPYPTANIVNPHNGFIQILAQYGVIVTLLFFAWMGSCVVLGWHAARCTSLPPQNSLRITGLCLVLSISVLPLTSMANSSFLSQPSTWMLLASLLVMAMAAENGLKAVGTQPPGRVVSSHSAVEKRHDEPSRF